MIPTSMTDDRARRPTYFGKYPGLVLDNAPPENMAPGSLLVELQTFQERDPASPGALRKMQCKAMPCLPAGAFILPDIGAPVWVEFAAGDPRYPLWTGAFYTPEAPPMTHEDAAPTQHQRLIRSVAGNVLLLDDTDGAVQLVLRQPDNNTITMNQDGIVLKSGENTITLKRDGIEIAVGDSKISLDSSGVKIMDEAVVLKSLADFLMGHDHNTSQGPTTGFFVPFVPTTPTGGYSAS
jgi:hypothetical protein